MNRNQFRRLRPLACVSPAQTAQPLLPGLRPLPPPKRTTEGVATKCSVGTTKLPPLPPPRRNMEGVATMCSTESTGLRPHPPPKRTTEGVATMCSVGTTKLPPLPPPRRNMEGVATMCSTESTGLRPHPPPKRTTEGVATMCSVGTTKLPPLPPPRRNMEGDATMCSTESTGLRPHPPPKRTTEGVATMCSVGTTKLPPLPPPQRNFEGVVTKCVSETTKLRPPPLPKRTTEEFEKLMKEFIKSRLPSEPQSVRLPSILEPSRGRYPPKFTYGVSAQRFQADLLREWRYNKFLEQEREKDLRNATKQVSQEKRAPSKTELKGENDWADFELNFNTCSEALKATKKVSEPKIKREEMDLTGESEEGNGNPEEMDSELMDLKESVVWEYTEFKMEMNEQEKVLKLHQDKNEELKRVVERIREWILKTENIIEKKKEKLKMKSSSQASITPKRKRIFLKLIYEKLAEVHKQCFYRFCCPDFVSVMLQDFDEWFSDWSARVPAKTLCEKQRLFAKRFMYRRRVKTQPELEALREERRQRRLQKALEIAVAPPVKISGRKLMPRSPPPKKVMKKEELLAAKNQW